ncbi:hypothetical protein MCETE7_01508 [Acidimicrobiia bacterium]
MTKRVFVTRRLPEPGFRQLLDAGIEVVVNDEDRPVTKDELLAGVSGADGVIAMLTDRTEKLISLCWLGTFSLSSSLMKLG